jgi:membrane fusion protein (multidrug efflux system)
MARAIEEPEVEERDVEEGLTRTEGRDAPEPGGVRASTEDEAGRAAHEEAGPEVAEEGDAVAVKKRPLYRRPAFMLVAALILIAALVFGLRYWTYARAHESTDDAFIDGRVVQVSPKITGYVAKVYVKENQQVKEGDLIAELDARDFEARLAQARAALAAGAAREREAQAGVALSRATSSAGVQQASSVVRQARSAVETARAAAAAERSRIGQASSAVATAQAGVAQAQAQVAAAQAEATRANADVQRYQELFAKDEVSRQRLDQAVATAQTATANLEAARRRVAAAEAQVSEARAGETAASENARRAAGAGRRGTTAGRRQSGAGRDGGRVNRTAPRRGRTGGTRTLVHEDLRAGVWARDAQGGRGGRARPAGAAPHGGRLRRHLGHGQLQGDAARRHQSGPARRGHR